MAERLRDDVWMLDLGLVKPFETNGYLVDDGDLTLIDPGFPWNRPSVPSELADAGYDIADIDRVLVTHFDLDHYGGLRTVVPEFTGPAYMGVDDADILRRESDPKRRHHKGLFHMAVRRLFPIPDELELIDVDDGDQIGGFTAYHSPGHNPGHMVYLHDSGVAFLGDLVWEEHGRLTPPFWLDSYDMRGVRESIRDLAERMPPFDVAAMAHGDPITTNGHRALVDCSTRLS